MHFKIGTGQECPLMSQACSVMKSQLTRMYGTTLWRRVSSSHIPATLLNSATARVCKRSIPETWTDFSVTSAHVSPPFNIHVPEAPSASSMTVKELQGVRVLTHLALLQFCASHQRAQQYSNHRHATVLLTAFVIGHAFEVRLLILRMAFMTALSVIPILLYS